MPPADPHRSVPSFCRVCGNACAILVDVDDGRVVRVTGDPENPLYRGYSCAKGRATPEAMNGPERLLRAQKRGPDGAHRDVPLDQALDEIAERLSAIRDEDGPRAIACYNGTMGTLGSFRTTPFFSAFVEALGTPMTFNPATIDSPGKLIAKALHGAWMAPTHSTYDPEVVLLVGNNPLVSFCGGFPNADPRVFLDRVAKGETSLIVIDPRRSDSAKRAAVHLQPRPGEDAPILACMIRTIIDERLYDEEFVDAHVEGFTQLAATVSDYTPSMAAERADVDGEDVVRAARMFAAARRGCAVAGTGPSMSGRSTLVEYLAICLDTLCGHYMRAGERVPNAGTLLPTCSHKAQAMAPWPAYGFGEPLRVRGLANSAAGLSVAALPDEILLGGPGKVRALISCGGNPAAAWPDQQHTLAALEDLDLLVQIDVRMSATARMADYVIAATMPLEIDDCTWTNDMYARYANGFGYPVAYGQFAPAVVDPPPGSDVVEEWEFFYRLAQRMHLQLTIRNGISGFEAPIDMTEKPTTEWLFEGWTRGSRIPLDEVKRFPHGAQFPDPAVVVEPADPGWSQRLQIGAPEMLADLDAIAAAEEPQDGPVGSEFPFSLICRRLPHEFNSCLWPTSPDGETGAGSFAFMNPEDIEALGLAAGERIVIRSARAELTGVARPDPTLRRGVMAMTHASGAAVIGPGEGNIGRLIDSAVDFERYSGQPRMSNIPVHVRSALAATAASLSSVQSASTSLDRR